MKYQIIKFVRKHIIDNDLSLQEAQKMLKTLNDNCADNVEYQMREVKE
jgi:hypothetical protein